MEVLTFGCVSVVAAAVVAFTVDSRRDRVKLHLSSGEALFVNGKAAVEEAFGVRLGVPRNSEG